MFFRTKPILAMTTALLAMASVHAKSPTDMIPAPADVKAAPSDAQVTPSGLASKILSPGTGESPTEYATVTVHYTGWTTDGKMFDSSVTRGEPTSFPLRNVIAGWTEGLQLMKIGEKRRFWIPGKLAYGDQSVGGRPAGTLVFDVELISFKEGPKPPTTPTDVAAVPADATKTASGLASKVISQGKGDKHPAATDTVKVHYTGWTTDGKLFDSSVVRGEPIEFPLNRVIKGWTEGVQLMVEGEKRRLWIPAELAYGTNPPPGAPAGMLVFDVELLSFKEAPKPPTTPEDVSAVPANADKTASGLASRVLSKGTGTAHPSATDQVTVHYSGWTTDGKMFDSSVVRGNPATFPLNGVIKGWTEGVQLMVVGEKRRFWIPAEMAYGNNPGGGRPSGMLVFDVELLEIAK